MKTTIIFETSLKGHRYEYLCNLYNAASQKTQESFVFILPFDQRLNKWNSLDEERIKIIRIKAELLKKVEGGNLLISAYRKSVLLRSYVKKYQATHVFLIFLMLYIPFILWILPKRVQISGIVYRSFLWEDNQNNGMLRVLFERLRYRLMAKSLKIKNVLLLNDNQSAAFFNKRFATDKFIRLPDPYTPLDCSIENIKDQLHIDASDNLFIQIGLLSERKGTLEILDALLMLSTEEKQHNHFYFAGKVADDIKVSFYAKMRDLKSKGVQINVKDEFVSFEFLNSLCASCDCLLTTYKNTCQSSGAIGYAAQYGKSVIGPSKGLLGYLIMHYRLGYQIDNVCANDIYAAISNFKRISVPNDYVKDNQLSDFLRICLN